MLRKIMLIVAATLLALPGAATGQSDPSSYQTAAAPFTTTAPSSPTGLPLSIDYRNPEDPSGKPHSVQKVVLRLHPGTRIDTDVPEKCQASDAQFAQQGASACPPGSRVGVGEAEFDNGAPTEARSTKARITAFNNRDELILFFETTNTPGQPLRVASRGKIEGSTITTEVPPLPGFPPPDSFLAVKTVRETIDTVTRGSGSARRGYITTPGTCPATGRWTNSIAFTYRNGVTQTVASHSPCAPGRAGSTPATARDRVRLLLGLRGLLPRPTRQFRSRCARRDFRAVLAGTVVAARAVDFHFGQAGRVKRSVRRDTRAPFDWRARREALRSGHVYVVRARVALRDGRRLILTRSFQAC